MLCYIPSMTFCLYHVQRLDDVMETMETINELKDIKQAVDAFSGQMDDIADSVSLLKALHERVLCRMELVNKFDKLFATFMDHGPLLRSVAEDLVLCLEKVIVELGPASEWSYLSAEQQTFCSKRAACFIEIAVEKNSIRELPRKSAARRDSDASGRGSTPGPKSAQSHQVSTENCGKQPPETSFS